MRTWVKVLLIVGTVYGLFVATAGYAFYAIVLRPGMIHVSVREHDYPHQRTRVVVPASLVHGALRLAGFTAHEAVWHACNDDRWTRDWDARDVRDAREACDELDRWRPALRAVVAELERYPDMTLLEADSDREHVRIVKRNGALHIDVNDRDAEVSISLPPKTLSAILDTVEGL